MTDSLDDLRLTVEDLAEDDGELGDAMAVDVHALKCNTCGKTQHDMDPCGSGTLIIRMGQCKYHFGIWFFFFNWDELEDLRLAAALRLPSDWH